jgi:hypothetical protein
MLRSALRSPRLYNVKPGRTQPAGPALLLDTSMWDLTPTGAAPGLEPADEDAIQGSYILDQETRARRGLPVLQLRPGAPADKAAMLHLKKLLDQAANYDSAISRVYQMKQEAEGAFVINVVPPEFILSPLDRPTVRYRCPGTEDVECGTEVSPNAASRLRRHDTPAGQRCPRTNTPLTKADRDAGRITTTS